MAIKANGIKLKILNSSSSTLAILPPFGNEEMEAEVTLGGLRDSLKPNLEVYLDNLQFNYLFTNGFLAKETIFLFLGIFSVLIISLFLTKKTLYDRFIISLIKKREKNEKIL